MRLLESWPRLVFILVPSIALLFVVAILTREHFESDAERAIRLVKESNSRKENFTVQQYLYTTVYHRKDKGEQISISGWRARQAEKSEALPIEFVYSDSEGEHVAAWLADLKASAVSPQNDAARGLSWH